MSELAEQVRQEKLRREVAAEKARRAGAPAQQAMPTEGASGVNTFGGSPTVPRFSVKQDTVTASGVDTKTGAPVGRADASFAPNSDYRNSYMQTALSQHYGSEVQMRIGPDSGDSEFLNPETGKWTLVDERGLSRRDLYDMFGPGVSIAPAIALGIGGFALGAPAGPATAGTAGALGGAAGTFMGEALRLSIGREKGVHDMTGEEIVTEAVKLAGIDLAVAAGTWGAASGLRGIKRILGGVGIPDDVAEAALAQMAKGDDLVTVKTINDTIAEESRRRFKPGAGRIADNDFLQGAERAAANRGTPKAAASIKARIDESKLALEDYYDAVTPYNRAPASEFGYAKEDAGKAAASALKAGPERRMARADEALRATQRGAREAVSELPEVSTARAGQYTEDLIEKARAVEKAKEDALWADAKLSYGIKGDGLSDDLLAVSPIKVKLAPSTWRETRRLQSQIDNSLFRGQKTGKSMLLLKSNKTDIATLQESISYLKRLRRQSARGQIALGPESVDINNTIDVLHNARARALKDHPGVLDRIVEAEKQTAYRAELFDRGFIGSLRTPLDAEAQPSKIFARLVNEGTTETWDRFGDLVARVPDADMFYRRAIMSMYRREATKGGVPSMDLHNKFVEKHGDMLRAFFPGQEFEQISRMGGLAKSLAKKEAAHKRLTKEWSKSWRNKIGGRNPAAFVDAFFTRQRAQSGVQSALGAGDVRKMKSLLYSTGNGAVWDEYKSAVGRQLRDYVRGADGGIDAGHLRAMVDGNRTKFAEMFGDQWVANMDTLLRGATILGRSSPAPATESPSLLMGLWRVTAARPLSPTGVGTTRLEKKMRKSASEAIAKAIASPEDLARLVRANRLWAQNKPIAGIMSGLGVTTYQLNEDFSWEYERDQSKPASE